MLLRIQSKKFPACLFLYFFELVCMLLIFCRIFKHVCLLMIFRTSLFICLLKISFLTFLPIVELFVELSCSVLISCRNFLHVCWAFYRTFMFSVDILSNFFTFLFIFICLTSFVASLLLNGIVCVIVGVASPQQPQSSSRQSRNKPIEDRFKKTFPSLFRIVYFVELFIL